MTFQYCEKVFLAIRIIAYIFINVIDCSFFEQEMSAFDCNVIEVLVLKFRWVWQNMNILFRT